MVNFGNHWAQDTSHPFLDTRDITLSGERNGNLQETFPHKTGILTFHQFHSVHFMLTKKSAYQFKGLKTKRSQNLHKNSEIALDPSEAQAFSRTPPCFGGCSPWPSAAHKGTKWPQAIWHLLVTTKISFHNQFPGNTWTLATGGHDTSGKKENTDKKTFPNSNWKRGRKFIFKNKTGTKNMFLYLSERQVNILLSP